MGNSWIPQQATDTDGWSSHVLLKVIRNHIKSSGLVETWVDSELIGPNALEQVMNGKSYKRGMHTHEITVQALWKLLLSQLLKLYQTFYPNLYFRHLILHFLQNQLKSWSSVGQEALLSSFGGATWRWCQSCQCSHMLREMDAGARTCSFRLMMSYFFRYDHFNYARGDQCSSPKLISY